MSGLVASEVVGNALMIGSHGGVTFLPVHRADLAVLLEVLKGIDDAKAFLDGAPKGHVIDDLVTNGAFLVDEEESTVRHELTFDGVFTIFVDDFVSCEDVVGFGNRFVDVRNERVGHAFDTTFVFRGVEPGPM